MVLSLSQVQCYQAVVSYSDRLRVVTDLQTLFVEIMALYYASHLLCELVILAPLVFHDFPSLMFGLRGNAFCSCKC